MSTTTAAPVHLADWVRDEQDMLWRELEEAIRNAVNGVWSMRAGSVARRIVGAARLVGVTTVGEAPWSLTASGVYEAVLRAGGIDPVMPTEDEWRSDEELMKNYGSRAELRQRYSRTVSAIQEPRESRWINGDDE